MGKMPMMTVITTLENRDRNRDDPGN